jgi:GTPase SAR1 family protein
MAELPPKNCVIIGPSQSGKTSLLGVLQFATAQQAEQPDRALSIFPVSPDMGELIALSNAAAQQGRLPITATQSVKRYVFDYEITHNKHRGTFRQVSRTRFSMIDTPGGAVLGERSRWAEAGLVVDEMEAARAEVVQQLRTANYIILCADSTDDAAAVDFVQYLPTALMETGTGKLPCEKLVICLTKADMYSVEEPGLGRRDNVIYRDQFSYEDPVARALRVISRAGLNTLRMYLNENTEIRVGWASVYGFDPKDGRPNYNPESNGLLIDSTLGAKPADILERWQPYQVIDPFVFLTMGDTMDLKRMPTLVSGVAGVHPPPIFQRFEPSVGRFRLAMERLRAWFRVLVEFVR